MTGAIAPVQDDDLSPDEWRTVLHNAAKAYHANPQDLEAYQAIREALLQIRHLNRVSNASDWAGVDPSTLAAATAGLLHGASLGTGELISGTASAIQGKGFGAGAEGYREALGAAEAAHPMTTLASETGGMLALPVGAVGSGVVGAIRAGVPLTGSALAALAARGALAGAVPGAIAGFSTGGPNPAGFGARARAAAGGAAVGGALGLLGTAVGARIARRHVERVADIAQKGEQRALTAARRRLVDAQLRKVEGTTRAGGPGSAEALARHFNVPVEQITTLGKTSAVKNLYATPPVPGGMSPPVELSGAGLLGTTPLEPPTGITPAQAEAMVRNDLNASAEVAARVQRHAPGARFSYWANRLAKGLQNKSFQGLRDLFEAPGTAPDLRQSILAEFQRRGIVFTPSGATSPATGLLGQ